METKISAGSYDLNKWLYGGYEKDIITTIYGPAGSGKSNFCLLVACSQAKKGNKVIFIDTEGGFSIDRVKQLTGQDYEKVLEIEPNFLEAYNNLGVVYYKKGFPQKARQCWQKALELNPGYSKAKENLKLLQDYAP